MTDKQLQNACDLAKAETDLEIAYAKGEVSEEFANKLRLVLMRGQNLNMMG